MPEKDNEELIESPGGTLPKDKLEVVAIKPHVPCELLEGLARFNF